MFSGIFAKFFCSFHWTFIKFKSAVIESCTINFNDHERIIFQSRNLSQIPLLLMYCFGCKNRADLPIASVRSLVRLTDHACVPAAVQRLVRPRDMSHSSVLRLVRLPCLLHRLKWRSLLTKCAYTVSSFHIDILSHSREVELSIQEICRTRILKYFI